MKLTKRIIKGGKKVSKRRSKTKSKTIKRKNKRFSRYGGDIPPTVASDEEKKRIEEQSNELKRRENQIRSALRQMRVIERERALRTSIEMAERERRESEERARDLSELEDLLGPGV